MSGILERIEAKLDAILASQQGLSVGAQAAAPQAVAAAPVATVAAAVDPLAVGGAPAASVAAPAVSAEQITALITPHVGNPALKAALQQQMAAMGIGALPDAQPHQYGELYQRFQQVITQFSAAAATPVAAAPASII
jgi:hypothetical protein